jgi:excisionase family DNA binding protein
MMRPERLVAVDDAFSHSATHELLTVAECAAYLRVHPKTLPELIRRHGLPCALVGRRRRFRRADIDRWLASRKEGS